MTARADLPRLEDFAIPADIRPDRSWTGQMLELASWIGAPATLAIIAARGGEEVYVPADPAASPFADLVDDARRATIARVYAGNRLQLPVGRNALARARRAGLIAAARAGRVGVADLAKILHTSRTHASYLVNHSDEGTDAAPVIALKRRADPRQIDLFPDAAE